MHDADIWLTDMHVHKVQLYALMCELAVEQAYLWFNVSRGRLYRQWFPSMWYTGLFNAANSDSTVVKAASD